MQHLGIWEYKLVVVCRVVCVYLQKVNGSPESQARIFSVRVMAYRSRQRRSYIGSRQRRSYIGLVQLHRVYFVGAVSLFLQS